MRFYGIGAYLQVAPFSGRGESLKSPRTIRALFSLSGFVANARLNGIFGDRYARVIELRRRKKRLSVHTAATAVEGATIGVAAAFGTCRLRAFASTCSSSVGALSVLGVVTCT